MAIFLNIIYQLVTLIQLILTLKDMKQKIKARKKINQSLDN